MFVSIKIESGQEDARFDVATYVSTIGGRLFRGTRRRSSRRLAPNYKAKLWIGLRVIKFYCRFIMG